MKTLDVECTTCSALLSSDTSQRTTRDDTLISVKDRGGLSTPSSGVVEICIYTESILRKMLSAHGLLKLSALSVVANTMSHINSCKPQLSHSFFCDNHAIMLMRAIIKRYSILRLHYEAKKATDNVSNIRHKLSKAILFQNT